MKVALSQCRSCSVIRRRDGAAGFLQDRLLAMPGKLHLGNRRGLWAFFPGGWNTVDGQVQFILRVRVRVQLFLKWPLLLTWPLLFGSPLSAPCWRCPERKKVRRLFECSEAERV
jgi:hypothetical protein